MANWSDPRSLGPDAGYNVGSASAATDAGLRSYMLSVYNYMICGVLLTAMVSLGFASSSFGQDVILNGGAMRWVITLAPLAFIMVLSFGINRLSTFATQALFWAFAVAMGLSLSSIFFIYSGTSIATTFAATSAAFAGLSLYGYTTQKNLSGMGTFLIMGVVGLFVASLLNLWLQSDTMSWVISSVGVLIFAGLTAYDTQMIKSTYFSVAGTNMMQKAAISGALNLYLDFINLFMYLLRFLGDRD
ncbi:MAG: Bax inhibitor-1/YccA family protein [Sphingomonadales bacterium]|nr:Bax inhibitor-1/YccA family protein [Sphingomonadales bacterium]